MLNKELLPLLKEYQSGDTTKFEKIYDVFKQLILYYGRYLDDDDAVQELDVALIELLAQLPLDRFCPDKSMGIKKYIAVCIRNKYISLSKTKQARQTLFTEYCDQIVPCRHSFEDKLTLSGGLSLLTDKQKRVVLYRYLYGYSDAELSKEFHISRQAVNRLKRRALSILREYLEEK